MQSQVKTFFETIEFDKMLVKVGQGDVISFKNNNLWLQEHPVKAIIFNQPEETWDIIKTTCRTTFKELIFGEINYSPFLDHGVTNIRFPL